MEMEVSFVKLACSEALQRLGFPLGALRFLGVPWAP